MAISSHASSATSRVEMPITAMLDMTFQLLSFFILTFSPQSALEGKIAFSLPAQPGSSPSAPEPPGPICFPEDLPEKLTLFVRTGGAGKGNISALVIETAAGPTPVADLANLRRLLEARRADAARTQVSIAADSQLRYACLMDVMDACLAAGFPNVGFATPPDLTR